MVFARDCGATTGFSTQVSILTRALQSSDGGNVFVADTDHGRIPSGRGGGPTVVAEWLDARTLRVRYRTGARVFKQDARHDDITVQFVADAGLTSHDSADARSLAGPGECYLLALSPAVETRERVPVVIPAVLALRSGGSLAGAVSITDTLVTVDRNIGGHWERWSPDSVLVEWSPNFLGGSLLLRLRREADSLRGRYEMQRHAGNDGRSLMRGDALAFRVGCNSSRVERDQSLERNVDALAQWRSRQRPDTAAAVGEAIRAFEQVLLEDPVHSLSLFNYRIAEYACWHGRLPLTLDELRRADSAPAAPALTSLEERSWQDAWGNAISYERRGRRGYQVRSPGPDGIARTPDDLVASYDTIPLRRERKYLCRV